MTGGIGNTFGDVGKFGEGFNLKKEIARAVTHAHAGTIINGAFGEDPSAGTFLASFGGSLAGSGMKAASFSKFETTAASAVLAGGIAEASGGDFFRGAGVSVTVNLLNHYMEHGENKKKAEAQEKLAVARRAMQWKRDNGVNWSQVGDGAVGMIGGLSMTVLGGVAIATEVGIPLGVIGVSAGFSTMGFGMAKMIYGFQGRTNFIPGGFGEATDIGLGGNGTYGQLFDIASGGIPRSPVQAAITGYGIYNSNMMNHFHSNPSNSIGSQQHIGVHLWPSDNTRVQINHPEF